MGGVVVVVVVVVGIGVVSFAVSAVVQGRWYLWWRGCLLIAACGSLLDAGNLLMPAGCCLMLLPQLLYF